MRRLILGTAGHIDHGKTTLVRALTGVDTDRLAEEKRRGITIDLGFARLPLGDDLELGVVDVPGHEAFVRNMLAGATGIDLALLVVAADEGVMPQTREHLAIVELLGVRGGVVAITKADLVEPEWLELVLAEVEEELAHTPFAGSPLVPVSATTGAGLDLLRDTLAAAASAIEERRGDDLLRLPIDRIFPVRGTGTVVTGTLWSGRIERDRTMRILPAGHTVRIRTVQAHGREVPAAGAGQRAAVGLVGVERDRIARGDVLVGEGAWQSTQALTVELRQLERAPRALQNRQRVRFHLGTAEVMARVKLLDGEELAPGEVGWAQLRLEGPVIARAGDRFVLRSYSPVTTIGGGTVAEPAPERRKRWGDAERARFEAVLSGTAEESVLALVRGSGWRGALRTRLPIDTRFTPPELEGVLEHLDGTAIVRVGERLFAMEAVERARERFLAALDAYHAAHPLRPGMDREELRRALPAPAPAELGEWVLGRLRAEGEIVGQGTVCARRGFTPTLNDAQRRVRDLLQETVRGGGLTPPALAELPPPLRDHPDLRAILRLLEQDGALVALTPDLYLDRPILEDAIAQARERLAGSGPLAAAEFRQVFPVSRKFLIPLLEYLDRAGITHRQGDLRVLA
jgi:selenocysteine-specific elongation factor